MSDNSKKKIVLWGDTQVGKTALLAAALFYPDSQMQSLCRDTPSGDRYQYLSEIWNRLRTNRPIVGTAGEVTGVSLQLATGPEVQFIDVRGHLTSQMGAAAIRQILEESDAVLFLAEYNTMDRGGQMAAIEIAMQFVEDRPKALALTKCERALRYEDTLWDSEPGWLSKTPLWPTYYPQLKLFHDCAWPTSVFGYAEPEKWPAVILGEMGQSLPFRIQPRNIAKPLVHLLRKLVPA